MNPGKCDGQERQGRRQEEKMTRDMDVRRKILERLTASGVSPRLRVVPASPLANASPGGESQCKHGQPAPCHRLGNRDRKCHSSYCINGGEIVEGVGSAIGITVDRQVAGVRVNAAEQKIISWRVLLPAGT